MPEFDRRPTGYKPSSGKSGQSKRAPVKRRQNVVAGIFCGLFPWKGDKAGDIVRKMIFLGSLVLITWAAFQIIDFYVFRDKRNTEEWEKLISISEEYDGPETIILDIKDDPYSDSSAPRQVEIIGEYLEYYERNNDFVGFIKIYPYIQYPVYQSDDNSFYLHNNHDKIPTENGTIFADYEGIFTETERPHNSIIYGHNLLTKNNFQPLMYYRSESFGVDPFDFLKEHPVISFDTRYERGHYKIFAVFQSNVKEMNGEVFDYYNHIYFESKQHFDSFAADCLDRSFYYTNVDLKYGDEILMLSTCDFSMFANGADSSVRLVIAARRVRDDEFFQFSDEEKAAFIDNRGFNAVGQVRRRMFDAYYKTYGTSWAGRDWDLSYIKDFAG